MDRARMLVVFSPGHCKLAVGDGDVPLEEAVGIANNKVVTREDALDRAQQIRSSKVRPDHRLAEVDHYAAVNASNLLDASHSIKLWWCMLTSRRSVPRSASWRCRGLRWFRTGRSGRSG